MKWLLTGLAAALLALALGLGTLYMLEDEGPGQPGPELQLTKAGDHAARPFRASPAPAPAPDLPVVDAAGASQLLSAYRGKPVLLNFWASWCAPCIEELPALDRLAALEAETGVTVVLLNIERDGARKGAPFLAEHGVTRAVSLYDPSMALWRAFKLTGLPTTVLIDAAGREIARREGPAAWDQPASRAEIAALLAAKP